MVSVAAASTRRKDCGRLFSMIAVYAVLSTTSSSFLSALRLNSTRRDIIVTPVAAAMMMSSSTASSNGRNNAVIDSHLHVWANTAEAATKFPLSQPPPDNLKDVASTSALLSLMDDSSVNGALIVQPINHKFDHSYVRHAIATYPDRFKGMLLHDPSLDTATALSRLEELAAEGFVGVRFNPYLWPQLTSGDEATGEKPSWSPMSQGPGLAVYKRCGDLKLPVGVMCFQGLDLHFDDITHLLEQSPSTVCILDHFAFTSLDKPDNFDQLLQLAKYNVMVKISALFRQGDVTPYERVKTERFLPLLKAFGAQRLMFGSDFPFVLEQSESYKGTVQLVSSWIEKDEDRRLIMGATAERLFGKWG